MACALRERRLDAEHLDRATWARCAIFAWTETARDDVCRGGLRGFLRPSNAIRVLAEVDELKTMGVFDEDVASRLSPISRGEAWREAGPGSG